MNEVTLIGRFVRDVELSKTNNGTSVLNNVLAVHRYHRSVNGEEVTDFIPVVFWNQLAELVNQYHEKGDLIAVSGRMQSRSYENKQQQKVYVVECHVNDVTLLPNNRHKIQHDSSKVSNLTEEDKAITEEIVEQMKQLS